MDDSEDEIKYGLIDDVKFVREELRKSTVRFKFLLVSSRLLNRIDDGLEDFEIFIFSEYVYGMGIKDKFDGKKMGFFFIIFDVVFVLMLEVVEENVYFNYEDYD